MKITIALVVWHAIYMSDTCNHFMIFFGIVLAKKDLKLSILHMIN